MKTLTGCRMSWPVRKTALRSRACGLTKQCRRINTLVKTFPTNLNCAFRADLIHRKPISKRRKAAQTGPLKLSFSCGRTARHAQVLQNSGGASGAPPDRTRSAIAYVELAKTWDPEKHIDNPVIHAETVKKRKEIDDAYKSIARFFAGPRSGGS